VNVVIEFVERKLYFGDYF